MTAPNPRSETDYKSHIECTAEFEMSSLVVASMIELLKSLVGKNKSLKCFTRLDYIIRKKENKCSPDLSNDSKLC